MNVGGRDIVYHDDEITVYPAVGKERLCSDGRHLVVVLNRHIESVYDLVRPLYTADIEPLPLSCAQYHSSSTPAHTGYIQYMIIAMPYCPHC
jgi:hypothetical protein